MSTRREFITGTIVTIGAASTCYRAAGQQPDAASKSESPQESKQLDSKVVNQFVGFSHGNFEGVKELVAKEPNLVHASWDWVAGDFETGLGAASHVGHRDIANFLLDHGARIDVFAMTMLGHTDLVRPVLKQYPQTHAVPGPHGIPMLSHAVFGRQPADDVFDLLIESGANVDQASNAGQTPLMAAALVGRVEIIERLLENGADAMKKDTKGKTALDHARDRENEEALKVLKVI